MESVAWGQGAGSGLRRNWGRKGANLYDCWFSVHLHKQNTMHAI